MSGVENTVVRISTARFAELMLQYDRLSREIAHLESYAAAFATIDVEDSPAMVLSVEEHRRLAVEYRAVRAARDGQVEAARQRLKSAELSQRRILEDLLREGTPGGLWISDPVRGPKWYVLLEKSGGAYPVLRRALGWAVSEGLRDGLSPATTEEKGAAPAFPIMKFCLVVLLASLYVWGLWSGWLVIYAPSMAGISG